MVTSFSIEIAYKRVRVHDLHYVLHNDTVSDTKALFGGNIISVNDYLCHTVERVKLSGGIWGDLL